MQHAKKASVVWLRAKACEGACLKMLKLRSEEDEDLERVPGLAHLDLARDAP